MKLKQKTIVCFFFLIYLLCGFSIHVSLNLTAELQLLSSSPPLCPSLHFSPFLPVLESPVKGITCSAQVGLFVMGMHD